MPNLNDLVAYLGKKKVSIQQIDENTIIFELKFYTDGGDARIEELEVHAVNNVLKVKATNERYPHLCPNRHINNGGFFCLGLYEDLKNLPINKWVRTVQYFLEAQYKCELNGVWPIDDFKQWAHGDGAKYQKIVEQYYVQFKSNMLGLTLEQLKVVELNNGNKKIYHVYANDELILVGNEDKVLNKRYTCICDDHGLKKHISIGKCPRNCAKVIFMVAINDFLLNKAEQEFWDSFRKDCKVICCNTMKRCEFRQNEVV
nr:E2 domain-associated cysteine-rich protein [Acinetobacter oleivorans]